LMHSHDPQKSDLEFQKEFEAVLKAATPEEDATADFTGFVFPSANFRGRDFAAWCLFLGATFTKDADFGNVTFTKGVSFGGAQFTENAAFGEANFMEGGYFRCALFMQDASFGEVTFKGEADFLEAKFTKNADFNKATFAQNADFFEATFMQKGSFVGATFSQGVDFSEVTFTRDADFNCVEFVQDAHLGATFAQMAIFSAAKFTQDADFYGATFTEDANFGGAMFNGNADFGHATFMEEAHFGGVTFMKNADFSEAKFEKKARFDQVQFQASAEFRETLFRSDDELVPGPIFSLAKFSKAEDVTFYKTNLAQALFHNCDVSQVNFSSVKWRRRQGSGKRMVFEEEVDLQAAYDLAPVKDSPDERDYELIAELYQQLKKNYDERKDYWTAGDFHYGEMEMKRLASRRKNKILRWLVRHLRLAAWYKYASHYGESYVRPAVWLGVTMFLFALVYPAFGLRYDSTRDRAGTTAPSTPLILTYASPLFPGQPAANRHKAQWRLFGNSCLTALEIAAFQKEPAYQPVYPWGRLLTLIETLLTSTLAALFFLAVRRQFRR
jgi:uncharacterized protein YjbI with pentapeptide repeats